MAYFLGRDVNVFLFTEEDAADKNIGLSGSTSVAPTIVVGTTAVNDFAVSMYAAADPTFISKYTAQADITGVDVSLATQDEDTSYMGQMQTGKVEIKKNYTVSLTRKKKNNVWDVIFNGDSSGNKARFGLNSGSTGLGTGLVNPKSVVAGSDSAKTSYGYRVAVQLKTGTGGNTGNEETLCITNCCLTSYSTTLNADGVTEETLEFMSYQPLKYGLSGDEINNTLVALTGM
tara:strand:+ start:2224 stop:2916 length:693 start_codon:yes stop_codon:yes gene_type:complete